MMWIPQTAKQAGSGPGHGQKNQADDGKSGAGDGAENHLDKDPVAKRQRDAAKKKQNAQDNKNDFFHNPP